jgi:hypothetical protein
MAGEQAGEQAGESGPGGSTLSEVVRKLHTQVFLVAIGIGILLVALAVGGASEAVIPVAIALVVVLVIAVVAWQVDARRQRPDDERGGLRLEQGASSGATVDDPEQRFTFDSVDGPIVAKQVATGRRSKLKGPRQHVQTGGVDPDVERRNPGGTPT